jgi:hypothetical protein
MLMLCSPSTSFRLISAGLSGIKTLMPGGLIATSRQLKLGVQALKQNNKATARSSLGDAARKAFGLGPRRLIRSVIDKGYDVMRFSTSFRF